jgi:hypothetical protein
LIECKRAAIEGARVFVVGTEVCIVASVLAINPDGMILVPVIISRDTIVEVAGKGPLGDHGAKDGDGRAGELHCAIVLWNWLKVEVVGRKISGWFVALLLCLDVVDGEELT